MKSIDLLENGGPLRSIRHQGEIHALPDPRDLHYQHVLAYLALGYVRGLPEDVPAWKADLVFDRWCAAWDLPDFQNAQRLAYLVDNYRSAIVYDLHVYAHADLGELWRARRWRTLLDILDHLPGHSWYAATVSMDEEHAKMMAKAMASRSGEKNESSGPSLVSWTPEVAALTNVLDAVRRVEHTVAAVQFGKKAGDPPPPSPRPVTPLERALKLEEYRRRKAAHDSLVARVLPHKAHGGVV